MESVGPGNYFHGVFEYVYIYIYIYICNVYVIVPFGFFPMGNVCRFHHGKPAVTEWHYTQPAGKLLMLVVCTIHCQATFSAAVAMGSLM